MSFVCYQIKKFFTSRKGESLLVLNDISFDFDIHCSYAIVGVSGTGKSTLLHILAGLEPPCAGQVLWNNVNIFSLSSSAKHDFLNQTIGLVFQGAYLIDELTVLENVMLKGIIQKKDKSFCRKRAYELLEKVLLGDKANEYPPSLSGGERQRVSVIRALFNKPSFLIADEPTGDLDSRTGMRLIQFILECHKEWGMGLILTTHDTNMASAMDKILELKNGKLLPK